jgi:hypothetical protein
MQEVRSLLIGVCLSSLTTAQALAPSLRPGNPTNDLRNYLLRVENERMQVERDIAERREAQLAEHQFRENMNRLAGVWSAFVEEYNTKKTFNIRKARELSKAFHALEGSGYWPKADHSK